ncbi:uncharacterized protein TRIVIDRAFT_225720 [Trichoderma virens Gv29-8]|uniref:DUF6603 domain-containing protein n=1 Tax=Hypocrea virens (strain Gv29-8 / FGSC 10586) TaxID=413071 RepID=G9N481_HYPVG|nr:uncharacterized protein TRIVIDRAFT_225720 [Trichoderma virens Gv29-8]EHK18407.1 hypothetical protein TRIVIDRAFT_225720 [Trichoderma virens Gv29-8]UKZ52619.1 hypothetical protein TrVGV298_006400 [Trichoderma virens]
MTDAYNSYEVHSNFINVGAGDGAIHLLVKNKTIIERAVLIDGGDKTAYEELKSAIFALKKSYGPLNTNNILFKFTAIVITHWDGDHYRALTRVLHDDFKLQGKSTLIDKNCTFYCPATAMNKINNTKWRVEDGQLYFLDDHRKRIPICKAVISTDCIGYDLFTNEPIFTSPAIKWTRMLSLASVYQCAKLRNKLSPIFLIVGLDFCFVDDTTRTILADERKKVTKAREINGASLMATIIWPRDDSNLRVSLYTGGDAEEERERHLLKWMGNTKKDVFLDVVKTGHHGSHFALPENIVNFKSQAFVISAGQKHGHPSFSVIFYLLQVASIFAKNEVEPNLKILGTRKPYWLDKPVEELTTNHLNLNTVMGYNDGTAVIFDALLEVMRFTKDQEITKDLINEFNTNMNETSGEVIKRMKNFFHLQGYKLNELASIGEGKTFLNQDKTWKPPTSKNLNADDEYFEALKAARSTISIGWTEHLCKPRNNDDDVQFVSVKANSDGIESQLVKIGENKTWNTGVKTAARWSKIDETECPVARVFDDKTGKYKIIRRVRNLLDTVVASADLDQPLGEWTNELFIRDVKKAQSQAGAGFPRIGRFERLELSDDASHIAFWLNQCFLDAATLRVSGITNETENVVLNTIDIQIRPKLGTETAANEPTCLVFTTDQVVRNAQFGEIGAGLPQTSLGYDKRLPGFVFALDTSQTNGAMSLPQFVELIGFPISPVIKEALSPVKLRLAPSRSSFDANAYKGPDYCSGLWFIPFHDMRVIFRMAMELDHVDSPDKSISISSSAIEKFLKESGLACNVSDILVTGTRVFESMLDTHMQTASLFGIQAKLSIRTSEQDLGEQGSSVFSSLFDGLTFTGGINFVRDYGFELTLQLHDDTSKVLTQLLQWCQTLMARSSDNQSVPSISEISIQDAVTEIEDAFGTILSGLNVHSLIIGFESKLTGGKPLEKMPKPTYFTVKIEAKLKNDKVPFSATLQWRHGVYSLSCELQHPSYPTISSIPQLPQRYSNLRFIPTTDVPNKLSIKDLVNQKDLVFPHGIPDMISDARFQISTLGKRKTVSLEGRLECSPLTEGQPGFDTGSSPPVFRFNELHIDLTVIFDNQPMTDFILEFDAVTELRLPSSYKPDHSWGIIEDVTSITTKVEHVGEKKDSSWKISGKVGNLQIAHLYDLFAKDGSNDAIMELMAGVHIDYIFIEYEYNKNLPGKLEIDGFLTLGTPRDGLELELQYTHMGKSKKGEEKEDSGWFFNARAAAATGKEPGGKEKTYKIATLLKDLVDDVNDLPEIVRNVEIPRSCLEANLACRRVTSKNGEKHAVFALTITIATKIGKFDVTLAQICSYTANKDKQNPESRPGRILRISLSGIGKVDIPVVGEAAPPFDQVGIVWTNRDITPTELDELNNHVFMHQSLLVKSRSGDAVGDQEPDSSSEVRFLKGFHFQVALLEGSRPRLILDHIVGGKEKDPKQKEKGLTAGGPTDTSPDGGKSVAPMSKTFGPLSIRNIGLSVSGPNYSTINLSLDAIVKMGPLTFALLGFTITLDLTVLCHPENLKSLMSNARINGMSVAFDKPPTRIAGMINPFDDKFTSKGFEGAMAVSLSEWSAMAGGRYEELYPDLKIKSFSLFGMVQGPIAEFGCAELNGLTGGFGYNSRLELPADASGVVNFPFIALNRSTSQGGSVMDQMNLILTRGVKDVISTAKEEMWLVAGVGIKAFQTFNGHAIFALTLNDQPKFAVLATATAMFPKPPQGNARPDAPPKDTFIVVDIAMSCVIDPFHGTVIATGELTPLSFILNKECKLTGSFAMAYFLPNSPHDGDFVFSVGGYHPNFQRPSHYPIVRNQVGIDWQYDKSLRISGEAYFAITPQAVMGGGRLDMVFYTSALKDHLSITVVFSAYANFLMHFHPFSFEINIGVSIYASAKMDLLLCTKTYSPLALSASLSLWGPPIAGLVTLKLWEFEIKVAFGPSRFKPKSLSLNQFVRVVKNLPAEEPRDGGKEKEIPNHIVSVIAGKVATGENKTTNSVEISAAGLLIQVQARVPVLSALISGNTETKKSIVQTGNGETITPQIFARPMLLKNPFQKSELVVTLLQKNGEEIKLNANPLIQSLPPALWGDYVEKPDLASLKASTIPHVIGYNLSLHPKLPSADNLPAILVEEFNPIDVSERIKPIEKLNDDGCFRLASNIAVEVSNSQEEKEKQKKKKKDVFAAWDQFKNVCSGGGLGRDAQLVKIFTETKRIAT